MKTMSHFQEEYESPAIITSNSQFTSCILVYVHHTNAMHVFLDSQDADQHIRSSFWGSVSFPRTLWHPWLWQPSDNKMVALPLSHSRPYVLKSSTIAVATFFHHRTLTALSKFTVAVGLSRLRLHNFPMCAWNGETTISSILLPPAASSGIQCGWRFTG